MADDSSASGWTHPRQGRWHAPEALLATVTAILAGLFLSIIPQSIVGFDAADNPKPIGSALSTIVLDATFVVVAVAVIRTMTGTVRPKDLGFRMPALRWRTVGSIVGLGLVFVAASYGLGALLGADSDSNDQAKNLGATGSLGAGILIGFITVTVAPLGEETLMRGVLYPGLRRSFAGSMSPVAAIALAAVVDGLVFGALHAFGAKLVFLPILAVFGIVLCLAYQFTGSLWPGILLHSTNNAISITVLLDWPWWRGAVLWVAAMAVFAVVAAVLRRTTDDAPPAVVGPAAAAR